MEQHGQVRWRRLPHWDLPGATYFVTACLEGSIPAEGKLHLEQARRALTPARNAAPAERSDAWKRLFVESDQWLDEHPAVRLLERPELARIVADAFYYWARRLYDLLAYVVMPSHVHWVFRPVGQVSNLPGSTQVGKLPHGEPDGGQVENPHNGRQVKNLPYGRSSRERIMHSIKRYTARECNRRLGRAGRFWQEESYDHCVRDDGELERIIHYVENNPVKAGLVESAVLWEFSSAHDRAALGLAVGQALVRGAGFQPAE
jgi:type I restriction enzyme R subunit